MNYLHENMKIVKENLEMLFERKDRPIHGEFFCKDQIANISNS